jgi:cysteinyl-tRNA synthetase
MALDLLGRRWGTDVLDIHAGGVDLICPHHEDEIAQSCAYTGKPEFARMWLHGEFLNIQGTKMSKRYGNILTARDLREQGVDAGAVRLLMFGTHYRKTLDWSDDALAAAQDGSVRLGRFRDRLAAAEQRTVDHPEAQAAADRFRAAFSDALNDDLNAPRAVAAVFDILVREGNRLLDEGKGLGPEFRSAWALADDVLDVAPAARTIAVTAADAAIVSDTAEVVQEDGVPTTPPEVPPPDSEGAQQWAHRWAVVRAWHKRRKDFREADRIRDLLRRHRFEVRDAKDGTIQITQV